MARNQVAPERPSKKTNNFIGKPQKKSKGKFNSKPCPKDELKPSSSGPGSFFVKPRDKPSRQGGVAGDLKKKSIQESGLEKPTRSRKDDAKTKAGKRQNLEVMSEKSKKPFDKKKYRLQKYSKKYKLQQWEDSRKKAVLREYYRSIKDDDGPKLDVNKIYKEEDSEGEEEKVLEENENNLNTDIIEEKSDEGPRGKSKKPKHFKKAMDEFERLKNEKQTKKEEYLKRKAEREEAVKKSKKEKALLHKKITRTTKKGQPIMKDRLEMLLERIQKSMT